MFYDSMFAATTHTPLFMQVKNLFRIPPSKMCHFMSCLPSICLLTFRVRYIKGNTVQDIIMKLGTNVNIIRRCEENKNPQSTYIFYGIMPL